MKTAKHKPHKINANFRRIRIIFLMVGITKWISLNFVCKIEMYNEKSPDKISNLTFTTYPLKNNFSIQLKTMEKNCEKYLLRIFFFARLRTTRNLRWMKRTTINVLTNNHPGDKCQNKNSIELAWSCLFAPLSIKYQPIKFLQSTAHMHTDTC